MIHNIHIIRLLSFASLLCFSLVLNGQSDPTQVTHAIDSLGNPYTSYKFFTYDTWTMGNDQGNFHINKGASIDGSYMLRINPSGNVGIGVDPTDARMQISGAGSSLLLGESEGSLGKLTVNAEAGTEIARFQIDGTTLGLIDEDGNMGIGTALIDAGKRLQVAGSALLRGNGASLEIDGTGTSPTINFSINDFYKSRITYSSGFDALVLAADAAGLLPAQLTLKSITERVGMGTYYPDAKLHVLGRTSSSENLIEAEVAYTGNSDIRAVEGVSTPADGYGYGGHFTGGYRGVYGRANGGSYTGTVVGVYGSAVSSAGSAYGVYALGDLKATSQLFVGTNSTQEDAGSSFSVLVNGDGLFEEVKIKNSLNWPDYVFDAGYALLPLNELKNYIDTHGHLPGIPSAEQIEQEDGYFLGDMDKRHMEKIEELTLYVIELNTENTKLRESHQALQEELLEMKATIQALTELVQKAAKE